MPTGGPTGVNKTFPQGRHENLKTGYSIGQRNNTWMIKQWKLCFRRPMKMEVCESTLHEVHYTFWNSEENWREEESFHRKEEETFSCRWFQQNRQDLRSLHELPTRSWQAFLGGRGRKRKKKRRKEDQEFFLKLMQALNKWNRYFHTGLLLLGFFGFKILKEQLNF